MEWIFNPELTEEDIKQIYEDPEKNPAEGWAYCRTTRLAYRHDNIRSLFHYYNGDSSYIDWLKEQKIIIPKEAECAKDDDLPPLNATSATEAAKSYKHLDKLNNDPGYLRLKIRELEEEVERLKAENNKLKEDASKIKYRNEKHRDQILKLIEEKNQAEKRLDIIKDMLNVLLQV